MRLTGHKQTLAVLVPAIAAVVVIGSYAVPEGTTKTYEVRPQVLLHEQDTAIRALDAYERVMMRYVDLLDKSLATLDRDIQGIVYQLEEMNARTVELLDRIKRVEKALGIEEPKAVVTPSGPVRTVAVDNPNTPPADDVQK